MSEHAEQAALIEWAGRLEAQIPPLGDLYAIPNGGKRHIGTARKLKAEGQRAGIPDLHLAYPANGKPGLYIEMKFGKNKPTKQQVARIERLRANGYTVILCYSWPDAARGILEYLGIQRPEQYLPH